MARFRIPAMANCRFPQPKFLRGLPPATVRIIALLILINIIVWAAAGIVLRYNPSLAGSAALSYALGLRHALDADHISAIDLMTRRLIAAGQRPVTVGTFFSLGHSTIVVVTCIVVAATSGALRSRFDDFSRVGNIIGTSVSAAVLLLLSAGNAWVLYRLVRKLREALAEQRRQPLDEQREGDGDGDGGRDDENARVDSAAGGLALEGHGFLATVFRRVFNVVDRPWKMFPVGLLFGLGFDTSSEIAILGIASIHGAQGTSIWLILVFPILFTAGMCLVDTSDGALMMALYTSKIFARDTVAILYYSVVLTGITIFVAAFIGVVQLLTLVDNVAQPEGAFWDGVGAIGDNFDVIGASICGVFVLVGVGSVVVYRPWRKRMDARTAAAPAAAIEEGAAPAADDGGLDDTGVGW